MRRRFERYPTSSPPGARLLGGFALAMSAAGCGGPQAMLEHAGPAAADVVRLWWILLGIGLLVMIGVTGFLLVGCFRRRPAGDSAPPSDTHLGRALLVGGAATVALLVLALFGTYSYSQPLADQRRDDALTIEVIGKRWWWKVHYHDTNGDPLFETANEIHIPVGEPVRLRLLSDDVIHSFWVPKLGGKTDLIRGRTNYLWLQADEPGIYRGQCAEFCGAQHALMAFFVVAHPREDFDAWVQQQAQPAAEPATERARRGRNVFTRSQCADCHSIRGVSQLTSGTALAGPDLTHLASRLSLAAGTLPNRRAHLGGWIADPQSNKPGNLMPAVPLAADDFNALLDYLETLE